MLHLCLEWWERRAICSGENPVLHALASLSRLQCFSGLTLLASLMSTPLSGLRADFTPSGRPSSPGSQARGPPPVPHVPPDGGQVFVRLALKPHAPPPPRPGQTLGG